jgi:predicted SnoaL-like aldol condensation-catalyzing enzyme
MSDQSLRYIGSPVLCTSNVDSGSETASSAVWSCNAFIGLKSSLPSILFQLSMKLIYLTLLAATMASSAFAQPSTTAANKKIVVDFYDLAFTQRKPTEAALKYISPTTYIQHNPEGKDGRDAFINGFAKYVENGSLKCVIKRAIAEKDMVVIHSHCLENPSDPKERGQAVVDIFRVQGQKIVEHWDVAQPIPEKSANANSMF